MSRAGRHTGFFAGERRDFVLNIDELEELQEKCDAGPEEVFHRVTSTRWRVEDIRETLRLGLKGAGVDPNVAAILVARYAGAGQLAKHKPLVACIISAAMMGAPDEDEPLGEPMAGSAAASPAENSASPPSTKSAGPSASRRRKSAAPRSGN